MKTEDLEKLVGNATQLPWKLRPLWDASGLTQNKLEQDCQPGFKFKRDTTTICYFPPDELNKPNAALVEYATNNILRIQRERDAAERNLADAQADISEEIKQGEIYKQQRDAAVEALKYLVSEYSKEQPTWPLPDIVDKARAVLVQIEKGSK